MSLLRRGRGRGRETDIICVKCGVNLLTGQKVAEQKPAEKPKRRRPPLNYLPWLAGGAAAVLVFGAVAALVYFLMQDPVGEAERMARQGNTLEALNTISPYTDRNPDDARAQTLKGMLLFENNQYEGAANALSSASRLQPGNTEAARMAIVAIERQGGNDALSRQISILRRLVEEDPGNAEGWYLLGLALGTQGDYAGQAEALQAAVEAGVASEDAATQLGLAMAARGGDQMDDARQRLLGATGNPAARAALGFMAYAQGEVEEAVGQLESVEPNQGMVSAYAGTRLAAIYMARNEYQKALSVMTPLREHMEKLPELEYLYALSLQAGGLEREAIQALDRISTGRGPYTHEAAAQLALIHMEQDNLARAEDYLRRAGQSTTKSAKFHTLQGRYHTLQGAMNEAQDSFIMAVREDPAYAPAHLELGLAYIARGSLGEGVRELERYMELATADGEASRTVNEVRLLLDQLKLTMEEQSTVARSQG